MQNENEFCYYCVRYMSPILSFFIPCSAASGESDTDDPDSGISFFSFLLLFLTIEFPVLLKSKLIFVFRMQPEQVVVK